MAEYVSVIDAARQLNKGKQTVFKIMRRLGIEHEKRRDPGSGNQMVAFITKEDLDRIRREMSASAAPSDGDEAAALDDMEQGVFYLIQLEPEHDPGRFKLGFTVSLQERLTKLRCSAPYATVLGTWPCRRRWEKTAIDCVTARCAQLHTEVFRSDALDAVRARCAEFFGLMGAAGGDPRP